MVRMDGLREEAKGFPNMAQKRVTVYEVAAACDVSIATVSRVINGHKHVHPDTRQRVFDQMKKLGYRPSHAARALSTGRSRVVSIWIGNLNSHYVMTFLGQLEQHLAEADFEMLLRNLWHRSPEEALPPVGIDGLIVLEEVAWLENDWFRQEGTRVPVVSLGVHWVDWLDHVGLDLKDGVREAIEHLIRQGCRRVASVSPGMRNNPEDSRYATYLASIEQAGREPEIIETPWIGNRATVEETMERYLAHRPCPDGLFCYNDDHAIAVCRTLRRHGLRIPEDVAVVGCDDLVETQYLECPISTIVLPVPEACNAAWQLLENRMHDPGLPIQSVLLRPHLEARASSVRNARG